MRLLVVGGSGFVGRLVLPYLVRDHMIRVFDRAAPATQPVEYVEGDITHPSELRRAAEGMDSLLYMAMGKKGNDFLDPTVAFDVNVKGVYLALEAARAAGISRAVYTSSMSVYRDFQHRYIRGDEPPDALDLYGFTKALGEQVGRCAAETFPMNVTVLRLYRPTADDRWQEVARRNEPCCHTAASDLSRALAAAVRLEAGFQIISVSGDYQQKAMDLSRAKQLLRWEPLARLETGSSTLSPHSQDPWSR